MQFSIERHEDNGFHFLRMTDRSNNTRVSIMPEYGGLISEFSISTNGVPFNILDTYKDIKHLREDLSLSYRGAKLSPFVCRVSNARYDYGGETYQFSRKFPDGSAIHGLLFDKPFEVSEQFVNEKNACITLVYNYRGEDPGYPFQYRCEITYTLQASGVLELNTRITNNSGQYIPIADGWHPYFRLQGSLDEWNLRVNSDQRLEFNEALVPTGQLIHDNRFLEGVSMKGISLDNCFMLKEDRDDSPVCELSNPGNGLRLQFFADSGYPYLQIYTPDDRNSIAIENLSGAPDCFNNCMGLLKLNPGDTTNFRLHYKIVQD